MPDRIQTPPWVMHARPRRHFLGSSGIEWRVYEIPAGQRGLIDVPSSLVFDSMAVARRVYDYPANWASLTDDALCALCERC